MPVAPPPHRNSYNRRRHQEDDDDGDRREEEEEVEEVEEEEEPEGPPSSSRDTPHQYGPSRPDVFPRSLQRLDFFRELRVLCQPLDSVEGGDQVDAIESAFVPQGFSTESVQKSTSGRFWMT